MWEMPCLSAFCLCVCEWVVPHVSLVLKCGPHSMWLNNEFSRLRTGEPTLLITQINKHADEPQQWNNDNTIGSVSSVADREDNYGYPPTPSLPLKHPLLHLFFSSHTSLRVSFIPSALSSIFLICFIDFFLSYFFVCRSFLDITALLDFLPQLQLDHFVVTERERMGKRVSD